MCGYSKEIEVGIAQHYPGRHIREWHQGVMSSRELLNMLEGFPFDSWFRSMVREDMEELIGDATVQTHKEIREQTLALLRGERKSGGWTAVTDKDDQTTEQVRRRSKRADQA